ncbi:MAG: hypothetical protein QXN68_00795 [Thermoplasmata archaeon]
MKLLLIKKVKYKSRRSDYDFYYLFFKNTENGKSYKTCISEEFRNYRWWSNIKVGDLIEINDEMVYGNLVDADVIPIVIDK